MWGNRTAFPPSCALTPSPSPPWRARRSIQRDLPHSTPGPDARSTQTHPAWAAPELNSRPRESELALRFLPGVLWIGLAAFFAWSGYHIGYEVKFSRDRLIWLAPFCSRDVRLAEVLHRTRFPSRLAVLEIDGGAHLLVDKRAGFVQFAVALGRAAPHLQVWA